jgi:hypothetical protein
VKNGVVSHYAFYEWYPEYYAVAIPSSSLPVSSGDTIRTSINAFTPTSGQIQVENLTRNKNFQYTFTGQTQYPLCLLTAEWIVEDINVNGTEAPFADYGSVTFTDTYTNQGNLSDAIFIDLIQNGDELSTCKKDSASSLTCRWITSP